ncbi:non-specific lipid-transfer protein 4.2-like [Lycium barbarum]|uniref:non-specific lipid-transfer protein 4.2-like n=1 Tax=Lycium barbarum TaxID=112863 RepID=UPI00293E754F|nr:non-specific lipid-transfer protein 4.2-like [Lycium barbarum]
MARLFCAMIILLLVLATSAEPSCKIVSIGIITSLYYIRGKHHRLDKPSNACCKGLNGINREAKNDKDIFAVCKCMENALSRIHFDLTRIGLASLLCHTHSSLASAGPKIRICARGI